MEQELRSRILALEGGLLEHQKVEALRSLSMTKAEHLKQLELQAQVMLVLARIFLRQN